MLKSKNFIQKLHILKNPKKVKSPEKAKNKSIEFGKPFKSNDKKKGNSANSQMKSQEQQLSKAELQKISMIEIMNMKKLQRNQVSPTKREWFLKEKFKNSGDRSKWGIFN